MKFESLKLCTLVHLILVGVFAQQPTGSITSAQVACNPSVVGQQFADFIISFQVDSTIPVGSILEVIVPNTASIKLGYISCGIDGGYTVYNGLNCTGLSNNTLQFPLTITVNPYQLNQFKFLGSFNAPQNSNPSPAFKINIYNSNRSLVISTSTDTSNIILTGLQPNNLKIVNVTQTQNYSTVVGQQTQVVFSITTLNPIPAGGGVVIYLPKWNNAAPQGQVIGYINQTNSTPICQIGNGMSTINCSLFVTPTQDTLYVTNMFPNGRLEGETFSFIVNNILNPISMFAVQLTVTTYSTITYNTTMPFQFRGVIDTGNANFAAQLPALVDATSTIIVAEDMKVSAQTKLTIPFKIPVPIQLSLGCTVLVTLPSDFVIVSGQLSVFRGLGMYPGYNDLSAQVDEQQRTIKILGQCANYTASNQQNSIQMSIIQNPRLVKPTQSFQITIIDNNGMMIATVKQNVTFTPTPGLINSISLVPHTNNPSVQDIVDVDLIFTPAHAISQNGSISIIMPLLLPATCNISTATSGGINLSVLCNMTNNQITLTSPFINLAFPGGQSILITFNGLQLPDSEQPILGITIKTNDFSENQSYIVDTYSSTIYKFFTPQSVTFLQGQITPGTTITYTPTYFRISNTAATDIPVNSTMIVVIPSQIFLQSAISVMNSCNATINMNPNMTCTLTNNTFVTSADYPAGSYTLTIKGAFTTTQSKNTELAFSIQRGLITPISTQTSDTFTVIIQDKDGFEVNYARSGLPITMTQGISIVSQIVVSSSYLVGEVANHTIQFVSPVPFQSGFKIQVLIPNQITPPKVSDIICIGMAPFTSNISCSLSGNRITLDLQTFNSVDVGQTIQFQVGPFINPASTQATSSYQLSIRSSNWYNVADAINNPGGQIQMKLPSIIKYYDFQIADQRQYALTTVTIDWVSTQDYPNNAKVIINYDQTQISPKLNSNKTVPCIFRQSILVTCTFQENKIIVTNIMPSDEYAGTHMQLTITNMNITVNSNITTNSWVLTTYLYDGVSQIDQIANNLTLKFSCNYPCQTCEQSQPSVCKQCKPSIAGQPCDSCNQVLQVQNNNYILYNNTCYTTCPAGTFLSYFQCALCDKKCKTCQYTSGTSCTSCFGNSSYPYLNGIDCSAQCNYGYFGNAQTNMCEKCDYNCETCDYKSTNCTSCNQISIHKFLTNNICEQSCPDGQYYLIEQRNNICYNCSKNCATCELSPDTCSSCPVGFILNLLDHTCVKSCPQDISVYYPANSTQPETCQPCKSSCKTCQGTYDSCTSCGNPLSLRTQQKQCVLECDAYNNTVVSIKNVCIGCSSSCASCQGTPDSCISCVAGTYFYQKTCLTECPMVGGDYQYHPDKNGICVYNGTMCQYGYKLNKNTSLCELKNQVCDTGYELNVEKTACVPFSTFYIPFPMLITTILLCIIPIVSKVKRPTTLITPNFTIVVSFMETICLIVLVAEAKVYGIVPTFYLAIVGLVFLGAGNAFFMLMYTQQVKLDSALKHWIPKYNRIANLIQVFGAVNFKIYRLLYSKLFGRQEFNCPLNEPQVFYRPFNLTSLFAIVTVSLPIIVSSIIGLIYVRWGYQLYITCIEMLFIEILLIILQITEYCQQKFGEKKYYKVSKREVEVKVRNNFDDSDDHDEYGTKKDKSKSKPKSIKSVRQLHNLNNRMTNKEDFQMVKLKQVEKEIEELHVEDMMLRQDRQCQSFRLYRPQFYEAYSSEESEIWQDFISEPSSPRSKEMLWNRKFIGRMHHLHDVYKMRDQFDNCYHEPVTQTKILIKPVNQQVQTNVLEMLGIDDIKQATIQQTDNEEFDLQPFSVINGRKVLSQKRILEVPTFEYDEIQGDFEADQNGKFLLVQKQQRLYDKKNRLVNRRGYLIDQVGNVINKLGKLIFYAEELSPEDDELPDPFCYDKIKTLKQKITEVQFRVATRAQLLQDKQNGMMQNLQNDSRNEELRLNSAQNQSSISNFQETEILAEEEIFIQKLTQPKHPKTKSQFDRAQEKRAQQSLGKSQIEEPVFMAMKPQDAGLHRVDQLGQMTGLKFKQKKRVTSAQNQPKLSQYVPGRELEKLFKDKQIKEQQNLIDQEFLVKMQQFDRQLNIRRQEFLNNSQGGKYLVSDHIASEIASQMEQRGLAHRNLSSVYGRVKQKFNKNIRNESAPSATIKKRVNSRMQDLQEIYLNPRVDGKELKRGESIQDAISQLDVSKQLLDIHHLKKDQHNKSGGLSNDFSIQDLRSNKQSERLIK